MAQAQRIGVLVLFCVIGSLSAQRIPQSYFDKPTLDSYYFKTKDSLQNQLKTQSNKEQTMEALADFYGAYYQWDKALKLYTVLKDQFPQNASYQFKYGGVMGIHAMEVPRIQSVPYVRSMRLAFEKVVQLEPKNVEAYWVLMQLYQALPFFLGGSDSKAQKMVEKIQTISPVEGALAQGFLHAQNNQIEKAKKAYITAITRVSEENCDSFHHKLVRSQSYYELGKAMLFLSTHLELALCCFENFIEHFSSKEGRPKAFAWERLSQVYYQLGNIDKGAFYHQKAIKHLPTVQTDLQKHDSFLDLEIVSYLSK